MYENEMLIFDGEIINAIPTEAPRVPGINYCRGWHDFKGMVSLWRFTSVASM
jgi:hypothetical protein